MLRIHNFVWRTMEFNTVQICIGHWNVVTTELLTKNRHPLSITDCKKNCVEPCFVQADEDTDNMTATQLERRQVVLSYSGLQCSGSVTFWDASGCLIMDPDPALFVESSVGFKTGLGKTRFFKKKPAQWVFLVFFGFFWVFGFFLGFFAQTRGFLGFFSVSRILLGASRL